MKLSIIIVNWNTEDLLKQCINSFYFQNYKFNFETYVVDNASSDNSVEMVKSNFPKVKIIENSENVGFAKANNIAMKLAEGEYILLLNSDTIVKENVFQDMVYYMDSNSDVAVMGPKVLNTDGSLQYSCASFPDLMDIFYRESSLASRFPKSKTFGKWFYTYWDHNEIKDVDYVSGACFLVRNKVLKKIGYLDEIFFMYTEEVDLCYRVKKAGFKIVYYPIVEMIHLEKGSDKSNAGNFQMYKSWFLYRQKHFSFFYLFKFVTIINSLFLIRIFYNILKYIFSSDKDIPKRKLIFFWNVIMHYSYKLVR